MNNTITISIANGITFSVTPKDDPNDKGLSIKIQNTATKEKYNKSFKFDFDVENNRLRLLVWDDALESDEPFIIPISILI